MSDLRTIQQELASKLQVSMPLSAVGLEKVSDASMNADSLIARADAHLLLGLSHAFAGEHPEALPLVIAARNGYAAELGPESREAAIATWALAEINAYLVNFDEAEDLYEDAAQMFFFGDMKDLMIACLYDLRDFLLGFAKDERGAYSLDAFLRVVAA